MTNYNGIDGDTIERGGDYNNHSVGHEVCNFSDSSGTLYGYVQPTGQINLEKLGGSKTDESVDGVTVIWTAGPDTGGTAVIGWYHNATVFRNVRKIEKPSPTHKRNRISMCRISAPTNSAVLLPINDRRLLIPRAVKGGIGQSNVWYAQTPESKKILKQVFDLIKSGQIENLPDIDLSNSALEGNPRLAAHLQRERSASLVKAKKNAVKKLTGKLCCEACGFDFEERYGDYGEDFCEVHHLLPLSMTDGVVKINLGDLAIVCSNCHRVIHRSIPILTIAKIRKILKSRRS